MHFISGLPRSGSTLLAAILRQNPALHAGMSSPVAALVMAMQRQMSQEAEGAPFIDDDQRVAVLRAIVAGYYEKMLPEKVVIDTNRAWCAKLPLLARLYPRARVIACVRDVSWIMDSLERVIRANPLEPSRMFGFDPGGTVYGRVGALAAGDGLVGFALNALREAYFGAEADRLMLVTYETLTREPARRDLRFPRPAALRARFRKRRLRGQRVRPPARHAGAAPGLHRVAAVPRETILPPGLFASFAGDAFRRSDRRLGSPRRPDHGRVRRYGRIRIGVRRQR